jgi:hypothetical protein
MFAYLFIFIENFFLDNKLVEMNLILAIKFISTSLSKDINSIMLNALLKLWQLQKLSLMFKYVTLTTITTIP